MVNGGYFYTHPAMENIIKVDIVEAKCMLTELEKNINGEILF